jgi:hypothetical protein
VLKVIGSFGTVAQPKQLLNGDFSPLMEDLLQKVLPVIITIGTNMVKLK